MEANEKQILLDEYIKERQANIPKVEKVVEKFGFIEEYLFRPLKFSRADWYT